MQTSGLRVGTPAGTTRGFGVAEFRQVGKWIGEVLDAVSTTARTTTAIEQKVRDEVVAHHEAIPHLQLIALSGQIGG
jgi:glycine hydroxymethyltransferase